MKLHTKLTIGKELHLIDYNINLKLSEAGSATFRAISETKPSGLVFFDAGYATGKFWRYYIGFVTQATPESHKHWTIKTRELAHLLNNECPVSLRMPKLIDVLGEMTKYTGLKFLTPEPDLACTRFFSTNDGYFCMRRIPRTFIIDDYVWWQNRKGKVWLGKWALSEYAAYGDIPLDPKFYIRHRPGMSVISALPALRPGMLLNGHRLTSVRFQNHNMTLRWPT